MPASPSTPARVFIACAPQDLKFAEVLRSKARGDRLPVVFDGFGEGRVDEIGWQLECRRRIRSARTMVVLVSRHTAESPRALWQVRCAREHGIPVVGITVSFHDDAGQNRGEAVGTEAIVDWNWKTIAATLMRIGEAPLEAAKAPADPGGPPTRGPSMHGSAA